MYFEYLIRIDEIVCDVFVLSVYIVISVMLWRITNCKLEKYITYIFTNMYSMHYFMIACVVITYLLSLASPTHSNK